MLFFGCAGSSLLRVGFLLFWTVGFRGSGFSSCFEACGIFPDQGLNPCPLHWQADSYSPDHRESPKIFFKPAHKGIGLGTVGDFQKNVMNHGSLETRLILGRKQAKHEMSLEHRRRPESKGVFTEQKGGSMSVRHRANPKRCSMAKAGTIWATK